LHSYESARYNIEKKGILQKNSLMKLLKIAPLLLLIAFLSSCTKEESIDSGSGSGSGNPSSGAGIQGNWKLVSISGASGFSTVENTGGVETKAEIVLRFASQNPVGIYNITSSLFKGVGVGYDYNGTLYMREFENNVIQFEDSSDMNLNIPPSNSESKYKLIGADSIYFDAGGIVAPTAPGSTPAATTGVGCKYKLEGKRLTFIMKTSIPQLMNQNGITLMVTQNADVNIVLEKQ
jgi:hypothetical protein